MKRKTLSKRMGTKYNRTISFLWIFLFLATLDTLSQSYVKGLPTLDKNSFGPKPKGTIKTIEALEIGDIIDCVDIYKQPAFDNPLIKDLKMAPSSISSAFNKTNDRQPLLKQSWTKYGKCPKGTIPIRRTSDNNVTIHRKTNRDPYDREYASVIQYFNKGRGGQAFFNTWKPRVTDKKEFSLSQLWVVSGRDEDLNTAEAGWMVNQRLYHDKQTRLFIFWSREKYKKGCYNVICPGFVQTNNEIALGAALDPVSVYNEDPVGLTISLSKSVEGDWWLSALDEEIGYFPGSIFQTLGDGADAVSFGGEIVNSALGRLHTGTAMGSGHFSAEGYKKACFISNIHVANDNMEWVEPNLRVHRITKPTCYDLTFGPPGTNLGSHFYFGGPGLSRQCL